MRFEPVVPLGRTSPQVDVAALTGDLLESLADRRRGVGAAQRCLRHFEAWIGHRHQPQIHPELFLIEGSRCFGLSPMSGATGNVPSGVSWSHAYMIKSLVDATMSSDIR